MSQNQLAQYFFYGPPNAALILMFILKLWLNFYRFKLVNRNYFAESDHIIE